jgi:hypothetical protein
MSGYRAGGFGAPNETRRAVTLIHALGHAANQIFGLGSSEISDSDGSVIELILLSVSQCKSV